MPILQLKFKDLITENTKKYCFAVYPGHTKGCPNAFGRCWGYDGKCRQTIITDLINPQYPVYIIYSEYNLAKHIRKMKLRHPDWTERQLRNVYYWQKSSFKLLDIEIKQFNIPQGYRQFGIEGYGLNAYATCKKVGLILDPIKGMKICRHMTLFAVPKNYNVKKITAGIPI